MTFLGAQLSGFFVKEPAFGALIIALSFVSVPVSIKIWRVHWYLVPLIAAVAFFLIPDHSLALETLLLANIAYPLLCKEIPRNEAVYKAGILWFGMVAGILSFLWATPQPIKLKESIHYPKTLFV